jgi:hypothetical protein
MTNEEALKCINFCIKTIDSPLFTDKDNCIWSANTHEKPIINMEVLKLSRDALIEKQLANNKLEDFAKDIKKALLKIKSESREKDIQIFADAWIWECDNVLNKLGVLNE